MAASFEVVTIVAYRAATADVRCLNCDHRFTADLDEDGAPAIETTPCRDDRCPVRLCEFCPQFRCDGCGEPYCLSHRKTFEGLQLCEVCCDAIGDEENCDCARIDVDFYDASGCKLHGGAR